MQLQIIKALHASDARIGVGMAMFQKPYQESLDRFIAGELDEDALLKATEYRTRWGFHWSLYKPIADFCKKNAVPLAALNVPSELTRKLSKGGFAGLSADDKATISGHWRNVASRTGQTFDFARFQAREGWIYDTEPACRAVVTMRLVNPDIALAYKGRLQSAFYAEGRDTTRDAVLADVAAEIGLDREMFFAELVSEEARRETQRDILAARHAGVRGFPTLLAGDGTGQYLLVTNGYRPLEGLADALEKWLDA